MIDETMELAADQPPQEYDPYEELANAIIIQAVKDYNDSVSDIAVIIKNAKDGNVSEGEAESLQIKAKACLRTICEVKKFLKSPWYKVLTDCDCNLILGRLRGVTIC